MTLLKPISALLCGLALTTSATRAVAQDNKLLATEEYRISCQGCHGEKGKGDGPFGKYLNIKPADLSILSKKNDGVFPVLKVFQSIDGRAQVAGHGDQSMPIWGQRYSFEANAKYGPYGGEAVVRGRILELVYYIQSLQQK
ncbi:MAG: cytochrome C [Hyphomicrobiaceae bacterium]